MQNEISTEKLQKLAAQASSQAQARARTAGIPYTIQKGKKIVQINPDGTEEIVGELPHAYCRPKIRNFRIANT